MMVNGESFCIKHSMLINFYQFITHFVILLKWGAKAMCSWAKYLLYDNIYIFLILLLNTRSFCFVYYTDGSTCMTFKIDERGKWQGPYFYVKFLVNEK